MGISVLPVYAEVGNFYPRSSINAGIRFSVLLGPAKGRARYGLHMSFNREFHNITSQLNYTQSYKADLVSLNFSESGFKGLSLVGQDMIISQNGGLEVVSFKKKKGIYYGGLALGVILGGIAVAGGFVLIVND